MALFIKNVNQRLKGLAKGFKMAKIKYSALLQDMRNKLNGSVMSKNRYGSYVRNKTTPSNPQTSYQQAQRQQLGSLSAQWRGLTQAQRQGWIDAAPQFPITDAFGDVKILAGNALYIQLNKNLLNAGAATISDAPNAVSIPSIAISALTATAGTPSATFTIDPTTIPTGYDLFAKATPMISPGISFVKNKLRFLGTETATAGSVDILNDWQARFGTLVEGQRLSVTAFLVSSSTGQAGVPVLATTIVAA